MFNPIPAWNDLAEQMWVFVWSSKKRFLPILGPDGQCSRPVRAWLCGPRGAKVYQGHCNGKWERADRHSAGAKDLVENVKHVKHPLQVFELSSRAFVFGFYQTRCLSF